MYIKLLRKRHSGNKFHNLKKRSIQGDTVLIINKTNVLMNFMTQAMNIKVKFTSNQIKYNTSTKIAFHLLREPQEHQPFFFHCFRINARLLKKKSYN